MKIYRKRFDYHYSNLDHTHQNIQVISLSYYFSVYNNLLWASLWSRYLIFYSFSTSFLLQNFISIHIQLPFRLHYCYICENEFLSFWRVQPRLHFLVEKTHLIVYKLTQQQNIFYKRIHSRFCLWWPLNDKHYYSYLEWLPLHYLLVLGVRYFKIITYCFILVQIFMMIISSKHDESNWNMV